MPSREILIREKDEFGKEPSHAYVFPKGTVLSAIKTSNKKVAVATADYGAERTSLQIAFGKAGRATISFTAKYEKQKKKYSIAFSVYRYASPVVSVKLGGREYAARFQTSPCWEGPDSAAEREKFYNRKLKIKVKPTKGYRLESIRLIAPDGSFRAVKNGKKVKISPDNMLAIALKNKKTGAINEIVIGAEAGS